MMTALVVTRSRQWGARWASRLLAGGCDVHTASEGLRGIGQLRKQLYDIIVVDDTLPDVSPLEFTLNLRELTPNTPVYLIAGSGLDSLSHIRRYCHVFFAGDPDAVLEYLSLALERARRSLADRGRVGIGRS